MAPHSIRRSRGSTLSCWPLPGWEALIPLLPYDLFVPAVGLLWFVVRREWRSLAIAVGTIGVIVLASFIVSASAWIDWIRFLLASSGGSEYPVLRLALGAILVVIGAATGRRWLVPVAVLLALPVPYVNSWVILLAVIRLRDRVPTITELVVD